MCHSKLRDKLNSKLLSWSNKDQLDKFSPSITLFCSYLSSYLNKIGNKLEKQHHKNSSLEVKSYKNGGQLKKNPYEVDFVFSQH